jgi:hypothetical protein
LELTLLEEYLPSFAVAMGLALQALGKGKFAVNLMPQERRGQRLIARKKPLLAGSVSLIFLLLLFMFLAGQSRISRTEGAIARADESLKGYDNLAKQLIEAREYAGLKNKGDELLALSKARNIPIDVLNKFNSVIPVDLDRIPDKLLKGFEGTNVPFGMELPTDVDAGMDDVNREKMWLLGLNFTTYVDEKTGAESLNVEFAGAVVFDEREEETLKKVKEKMARRIGEIFNVPADKPLELLNTGIIRSLTLYPNLSQMPDSSRKDYFKFTLKWSVPLRAGFKVEEAPKKPPKGR